jgi:LAS superfamily LD-carboxypeptidase LdcB
MGFSVLFFLNLTKIKPTPDILYTVSFGEQNKDKKISVPQGLGFADVKYFPINEIMEQMGFVLAGGKDEFSFVRSKSGEYIKLMSGSLAAYINDETYYLNRPPFADGGGIYVPLEFLRNVFFNLALSFDEKDENKINIAVGEIGDFCLKVHKANMLSAADEYAAPYFTAEPESFKADLSEYEKYFNPPAELRDEFLILVNQKNPLSPDYAPPDLADLADTRADGRAVQKLRLYPAKALEAFLIEARANGQNNITVTSAYRTYAYQDQLYREEAERLRPAYGEDAEEIAAVSVMPPGYSEHQSGLSLDMHTLGSAAESFGSTPEGSWLAENAHRFGFILRYPADKTDITGIKYEPWHFRYVGSFQAAKIYASGLCFEEYCEAYLKN